MLFNSYTFLIFFAIVLCVSRKVCFWKGRKFFLLCMSYVFYMAWNPPFVILLWISTVGDWFFAKWMYRSENNQKRTIYLIASLVVNLGLLGYFKYATFVLDNFTGVIQALGFDWNPAPMSIVLPVGISFYTFQTLSYTMDVYRRQMKPSDSFLDYALYVTFFPQLVAGPIVRAKDFIPQCKEPTRVSRSQLGWGMTLFVVGMFNKVVIADAWMSGIVENGYQSGQTPGFLDAWAATLSFGTQIYCDFAGYSTCAIGIAMCLGFSLPDNFRFPHAAVGFSDFWKRWHISLSSWLRDYLYISLGGNRKGAYRTYRNLALTMLLGGLWHGAGWTFVVWGGMHGLFLVIERLLRRVVPDWHFWRNSIVQLFLGLMTYICVCYAWVFFRAESFRDGWNMVLGMSARNGLGANSYKAAFAVPIALFIFHWFMRNTTMEEVADRLPWWIRSFAVFILVVAIFLYWGGEDRAFIYFQF
ncbi:MAG: MBOAT family O-acyltransferase [Planctomycetota bacterium]